MKNLEQLLNAIETGDQDEVEIILASNGQLINQQDESGATPLHYAAWRGKQQIAELLIERGADVNAPDGQHGATPTGWAIEYLREKGGHLVVELDDLTYAIQEGDIKWVTRFLQRFPGLRNATDIHGKSFRELAGESGNREVKKLFEL